MEHVTLADAVGRHVRPGDTVYVGAGHHRWTAAARELARQFWGSNPGFELVIGSLGSLGVLFVHGGLVRRVVTAYSGDVWPASAPNPVFQRAYDNGLVDVEHWSSLTLIRRLEAAAAGLPAAATKPLGRASMASNPAYAELETPHGRLGLLSPLVPDVTLLHAIAADREGNIAVAPPSLDGVAGAYAARRGCVVTVERVVDDLRPFASFARIPAHRVLAVAETPYGAHPGGLYGGGLALPGYAEDVDAWIEARDAARGDLDKWVREWCLEPATHEAYLERLGHGRIAHLRTRLRPDSWREDAEAYPVDDSAPPTQWEVAAAYAARELVERIVATKADAVLAGDGAAHLAAWVAVARSNATGLAVRLAAEVGLWGYVPAPADGQVTSFRAFLSASMLTDASTVLGTLVGGPGTRMLGCLGAAQIDSRGDINSTVLDGGRSHVGAGSSTDVAVGTGEALVVTLLQPERTPDEVGYVTAPGSAVQTVVTDLGVLKRRGSELRLAAIAAGEGSIYDRIRVCRESCGWDLAVDREVADLPAVTTDEVLALRRFDPRGWLLT